MGRSVLVVLGGFVLMVLLVMVGTAGLVAVLVPGGLAAVEGDTPRALPAIYLAANLLLSLLAAMAGGWLTALLAEHSPRKHVFALAALVAALSIYTVSAEGRQSGQPGWYALVVALLGIGGVVLGGALAKRRNA
jgi:hypothetical protein